MKIHENRKILYIVSLLLILVGCASHDLKSALHPAENIGESVICDETNCKEQWERAQLWLASHSKMKVQIATDVLLETYNPPNYWDYGFTITKNPIGGEKYEINMKPSCPNFLGCSPKPDKVKKAFYYYIQNGKDLLSGAVGFFDDIR